MVAMATRLFTVYCKLFHMMPYIIILKVRKFHQPTASRFSTEWKKPVGGHNVNRDKIENETNLHVKVVHLLTFTVSSLLH